jgi:hypothetical protein
MKRQPGDDRVNVPGKGLTEMQVRDWELHINVLGWLYLLSSFVFLVLGLVALVLMAGIGLATEDPIAFQILGVVGISGALFFTLLALPGMAAGYGLLKRYPWARVLALIVAFFNLANFPIGSAIGVYTFVVLLQAGISDYFAPPKMA